MTILQQRNDQLVDLLSPEFWGRNEPNVAWRHACSAFQALPGLRGFWPMSSFDENGDAFDLSEQDRTLSYNGNPAYNYDALAPYIDMDGTGDFLNRADEAGLDILGTEAYVAAAARGLTMGGWFYFNNPGVGPETCISKWNAATNNRSYRILTSGINVQFQVSVDGIASTLVTSTDTLVANTWYFLVGRFDPSTTIDVYFNNAKDTLAVAIPATIFNSNADFMIGARQGPFALLIGRASLCFLSTIMLSDAIIGALFEQTRVMFGV